MTQEINKKKNEKYLVIGLIVLSTILSVSFKLSHFDYTFGDYIIFLSRWVETIKANGYLSALAEPFYNYTPLYMYILTLIAWLDINSLYAIKTVSILFEYVAAFYVGRIAFLVVKKEWAKWIPFAIVPIIPSVMLNSSFMSQCDAIYVSFLLGSVYYLLTKRQIAAVIFLGIAFSLKSQSAFILPFYFVYMLRGHIKWYMFLIVPLVYFVSIIPAWIAGRPLLDLLTVYVSQTGDSYVLSSFFPNIYIWIHQYLDSNKLPGMIFVTCMVLAGGFALMNKKYKFSLEAWITLLFLSAIICPYFLPSMHERYLYFGDLVAILYVSINRKNIFNWLSAIGVWAISLFSYSHSLLFVGWYYDSSGFDHSIFKLMSIFPWQGVAFMHLMMILHVIYDLVKIIKKDNGEKEFIAEEI